MKTFTSILTLVAVGSAAVLPRGDDDQSKDNGWKNGASSAVAATTAVAAVNCPAPVTVTDYQTKVETKYATKIDYQTKTEEKIVYQTQFSTVDKYITVQAQPNTVVSDVVL